MTDHVTTHQAAEDARNEDILIYLNGQLLPKERALVSVYDSGFMLGDGVWEGLRLYSGTWAFMDEHLNRLFEAAKAVDIDIGMDRNGVERGLARYASGQWDAERCARSAYGHARGEDPPVPASRPVTIWPHIYHHNGTFKAQPSPWHSSRHCTAYAGPAHDAGSKIKFAF